MNYLKTTLFLFFLSAFSLKGNGQDQLGVLTSVDYGELLNKTNFNYFDSNTTFGFGVFGRKQLRSNFYISGSLSYQKLGWYILDFEDDPNFDVYWKGKSINFFVDLGYHLIRTEKFKLGPAIGINRAILIDQEFETYQDIPQGNIEFYTKVDMLPSFKFSLDLIYDFTEKFAVNLRPNWTQIPNFYGRKYNSRNMGVDLVLLYNFDKKQ